MKCTQRLYLTADRKSLVPEEDGRAAFLYASPGDEIPDSAAEMFGLVDGALPEKGKKDGGSTKEKKPPSDKEKKGGSDKSGGGKANPQDPPGIGSIKGIGPATEKMLADAGINTPAALAAVDPAAPPTIEKLPPGFDWQAVVTAAKELGADTQPDTIPA